MLRRSDFTETYSMAFLTEPEPQRGVALPVLPGIRRIVAANPSPMTYHGTNTYLIDSPDGIMVLDPGPDDPAHVAAIVAATGGKIAKILLSHGHRDHTGGLAALLAARPAPVWGFGASIDPSVCVDHALAHGDMVDGWTVLHTPGHAADHVCFARGDGVVLTADHVMGWSTSVVGPPNGDMAAYFNSLRLLIGREDKLYLPGHGPPLPNPRAYVRNMLNHRIQREAAIAGKLGEAPRSTQALVDALYSQVNPVLRRAAERNVTAHLLKLQAEGRAVRDGEVWRAA